MSGRLLDLYQRSRARVVAGLSALFGPSGLERDELLVIAALLLVARGFWLAWRPGAYLFPGLIILWIALPAREVFITRPVVRAKPDRGKD